MRKFGIIICILTFLLASIACQRKANNELHLISSNYIGRIIIYFNDSNGVNSDSLGNRIYKIGKNGTLISSSPPNDGFIAEGNRIFVYQNDGQSIKIPVMMIYDDSLIAHFPDSIFIFNLQVGRYNNLPFLSYCIDSLKKSLRYYDDNINLNKK